MNLTWQRWVLKEALRRPLRACITAGGVAVAVAAVTSLLTFQRGYERGMGRELDRLGAHVLVVPKGCPFDAASIALHGANWPCYLRAAYLDEVLAVSDVATAAPALMAAFPSRDGIQNVVVGVTESLLQLKPGWQIQGRFPKAADEVLIGAELARRNRWAMGSKVSVEGLAGVRTVSGVLDPTGGPDDAFAFLPLGAAQGDLKKDRLLTHILVRLKDPAQLDSAVLRLRGCNAGMDMNIVPLSHLFRSIQGMMGATHLWLGCVAAVAVLAAAAGVGNSLLMAVAERTREIGVMRAVGASRLDIFRMFWMETLLLCVSGSLVGILVAQGGAGWVEAWLRERLPFAPSDSLVRLEPGIVLGILAGSLVFGSVAGFVPAWRAARLSPREAMRSPSGS